MALSTNKKAQTVKDTIITLLPSLSSDIHTLTYDHAPKFSQHEAVNNAFDNHGYFIHPYCSGERGLSENTNGINQAVSS